MSTRKGKSAVATVICVIIILVCVGFCVWFFLNTKKNLEDNYEQQISELQMKIAGRTRTVYVAKEDIRSGAMISRDLFDLKEVITDAADYVTDDDFGKTMLVDVPAGTEIKKSFVSGEVIDTELREVEYSYIEVTSNVNAGDYVDVRIMMPDGSDFIIASKKQVKMLNETKLVCDLWMSEEEILMMDSAAVDAYLYRNIEERVMDSRIYVTKYIMPTVQGASVPNYAPSEQTAELIAENPNITRIASQYLSSELRQKRQAQLNDYLPKSNEGLTWYDSTGRYLGRATQAEVMGNDIVNSTGSIAGSELPPEYGVGLFDDLED